MKIGLYFGSFNPVHTGHCIIANHVAYNSNLDQVWFVVSPQNPLKSSNTLLNEFHRLHLVKLAIEGEAKLQVSDIEFRLPRPSFTIDTLIYLKEKYPSHEFSIILGSDSYENLINWKNGELIKSNYDIYIYIRQGIAFEDSSQDRIHVVNAPLLDISSTLVRSNIKLKKSIRFMVPDAVQEEILKNSYYK